MVCSGMFDSLTSLLRTAWESFAVRLLLLGLAVGLVPFYILSLAVAALGGN